MRYAIISDIHSNFEALTAVLDHIQTQMVDSVICLGDVVGYGPNPNECVELIKLNCSLTLMGNHDFACLDQSELDYFNDYARQALLWTIENLTPSSIQFISKLPLSEKLDDIFMVHASPDHPSAWNYIMSMDDAMINFNFFETNICVYGHTHLSIIFTEEENGGYSVSREAHIKIDKKNKYLINVGSVGQPRDYNSKAAYGIIDTVDQHFQLHRVAYDYRLTQEKMRQYRLSDFLIHRLENGR